MKGKRVELTVKFELVIRPGCEEQALKFLDQVQDGDDSFHSSDLAWFDVVDAPAEITDDYGEDY